MSKELEVAVQAANAAGLILKKGWEEEITITTKADNSLVTTIDGESEKKIIAVIKDAFPNHRIVAEESGEEGESEFCWYIDPIDGTTNYSRRVPLCVVSIALAHNHDVIVGVIYNPFTDELFTAEKGQGTFLNGKKVQKSEVTKIEDAVIAISYSHDPQIREKVASMAELIINTRTKRDYGSTAYEWALLASGRLDALYSLGHNKWDFAAGYILAKEAGVIITSDDGSNFELNNTLIVAACTSELHQELLRIIGQ